MNDFTFSVQPVEPAVPILFDEAKCTGCNRCIEACQMDVFIPNEIKGKSPIVAYADECWYCGCCVMECPYDAIKMQHPLMNQACWVEKSSLQPKGIK